MSEEQKFYQKFTQKKASKKEKQSFSKKEKSIKQYSSQICQSGNKTKTTQSKQDAFQQNQNNKNKNFPKNINLNDYKLQNSLFSTKNIPYDTKKILEDFDQIVQAVRPLNSRQIQQLPDNIKMLSHQLTDKRSERRLGYLNDNIQLSSYVRYYTW